MLTGACLCGDIAFEIDGPVDALGHCHCSMCRKSHGSAFATFAAAAPQDFRWVRGAQRVKAYESSAAGYRRFCPRCGSALPTTGDGLPFVLVPLGNVAEDPGVRPRLHMFTGSMAPWDTIVDDLPQYAAMPPEYAATAMVVDRPDRAPRTPGATGGSCLCGAVAFEFDGPPLRMYHCHCSRCRHAVSAAYQTVLRVPSSAFRWLAGADDVTGYGLPGTRFECAFCSTCGARVPWVREEELAVPAGCLDQDPGVRPTDQIFTDSRAAWTVVDESLATWAEAGSRSRP